MTPVGLASFSECKWLCNHDTGTVIYLVQTNSPTVATSLWLKLSTTQRGAAPGHWSWLLLFLRFCKMEHDPSLYLQISLRLCAWLIFINQGNHKMAGDCQRAHHAAIKADDQIVKNHKTSVAAAYFLQFFTS